MLAMRTVGAIAAKHRTQSNRRLSRAKYAKAMIAGQSPVLEDVFVGVCVLCDDESLLCPRIHIVYIFLYT